MQRTITVRFIMLSLALVLVVALGGCGAADPTTGAVDPAASGSSTSTSTAQESTSTEGGQAGSPLEAADASVAPEALAIDWGAIEQKVGDGAMLLGVDTKEAYDREHVADSKNVPLSKLKSASAKWSKDEPIVLTSDSEAVARSGAAYLIRSGFTEVYYLAGGFDEWEGTFKGTDARKTTTPARLYYIYSTDKNVPVLAGDLTSTQLYTMAKELADSMEELKDEFDGDVDVESIVFEDETSRVRDLVDTYDVPTIQYAGAEWLLTPRWILVDKDGRVENLDAMPLRTQYIHGWCVRQAEAE